MPRGFMATISKENQFSFSQINEDTLLIFIDEWSTNFLDEDILKRLLQGKSNNFVLNRPLYMIFNVCGLPVSPQFT